MVLLGPRIRLKASRGRCPRARRRRLLVEVEKKKNVTGMEREDNNAAVAGDNEVPRLVGVEDREFSRLRGLTPTAK